MQALFADNDAEDIFGVAKPPSSINSALFGGDDSKAAKPFGGLFDDGDESMPW